MEDLESAISQILRDPESMSQILSLAKSFGVTPPGPQQEQQEQQDAPQQMKQSVESALPAMAELIRQAGSVDPREVQLLNALKPYCSEDRCRRIDRALRAARLSQIAGAALRSLIQKE